MAISGIGPSVTFTPQAYPTAAADGRPTTPARAGEMAAADGTRLTPEQQQQVQRLRAIDQKVRAHEQAHLSAAAGLAISGANFQYVRGPDGRQYAVAGEVSIDVSPAQTPEATIDKARRIQAAALAPADPSPQDRAVAAAAAQMAAQAQAEKLRIEREETEARDKARTSETDPANAPTRGEAPGKIDPPAQSSPQGQPSTPENLVARALRAYAQTAAFSTVSGDEMRSPGRIDQYA